LIFVADPAVGQPKLIDMPISTSEKPSTLHIPDEDEDTKLKREQTALTDPV